MILHRVRAASGKTRPCVEGSLDAVLGRDLAASADVYSRHLARAQNALSCRSGARRQAGLARGGREDRSRIRFNANSPRRCGLQRAVEFRLRAQVEPLPFSHPKRG